VGAVLPWVVAAGCAAAALAAWVLRPSAGPAAPVQDGAVRPGDDLAGLPTPGDEPTEDEREACRRARLALRQCQRDTEQCRTELQRDAATSGAATPPPEVDCLARVDVAAEIDRRAALAASRTLEEEQARVRRESEARNASARRIMEQVLGLSQNESGWISDFACRTRRIQESAAADVVAGRTTPEEAWRKAYVDRRTALRELTQRIPRERFPPVQEFGALLIMLRSIDCPDDDRP
jgi:hypothetical protein